MLTTVKSQKITVLIMAAGTGGHVFPALSIADALTNRSVNVEWLGTPQGMENELLAGTPYVLHRISVRGLRGSNLLHKILAIFMLLKALAQSISVISKVKPHCILGMGGFVCGPAGIAARLMRKPLLIHEQNAVAGITNKILGRFADRVLESFPGTFNSSNRVKFTGNPLRNTIVCLNKTERTLQNLKEDRPLNILVLGGSQGAAAINCVVPEMLVGWVETNRPHVIHQAGSAMLQETKLLYRSLDLLDDATCRVVPFIEDMAKAYTWADLVICRSGASTVSELAAVGCASILIPYPYHHDQQQTLNARWLTQKDAAYLIHQVDLSPKAVLDIVKDLDCNRDKLFKIGQRARAMAVYDASDVIVEECMELVDAG